MLTDDQIVEFVRVSKGTWSNAFPWGFAYRFDAPGHKRVPFTLKRLNRLIGEGRITREMRHKAATSGRLVAPRVIP